jgi:hypothetical protein
MRRWPWWVGGGLFAVLALWLLGGGWMAVRRMEVAQKSWESSFGSLDALVARHRRVGANATTVKLERLMLGLGIDLYARSRPTSPAQKAFAAIRAGLAAHVEAEASSGTDGPLPLLAPIENWLGAHAADIDAIARHLVESEPPVWDEDLSRRFAAPFPRLTGLRQLQHILLAHALVCSRRGDGAGTERALRAAWILNRALHARAQVVSQLLALATDRMQLGVLRRVSQPAATWDDALAGLDFEGPMVEAFGAEAWIHLEEARRVSMPWGGGRSMKTASDAAEAVLSPFVRPYARFCFAEYTEVLRGTVLALQTADPCVVDPQAAVASSGLSAGGRLNLLLRVSRPQESATRGWNEMLARRLEAEMTRQVLRVRQRRAGERTPMASVPSAVCAGASWVHTLEPDGVVRIALDRPVFLKRTAAGTVKEPWQYEVKRRAD